MGNVPHYPWYPDDYLSSPWVMGCTLAEEGIYRRLLDFQWKSHGCQLPDDLNYLRTLLKRKANDTQIMSVLNANFTRIELNGDTVVWRNERLYVEFCRAMGKSDKAREAVKLRKSRPIKQSPDSQTIEHKQCSSSIERQSNDNPPEVEVKVVPEVVPEPEVKTLDSKAIMSGKPDYEAIISDLNRKSGKNFKHRGKSVQEHINARFAEGHTIDDFYKVHDNMIAKWGRDPKMKQYIRPQTLYLPKFDAYLNMTIGLSDKGICSEKTERGLSALDAFVQEGNDADQRKV